LRYQANKEPSIDRFTPIDEQVKISQEVRVMFKYFVIIWGIEFGMVAAAIQTKVDCVDYISH